MLSRFVACLVLVGCACAVLAQGGRQYGGQGGGGFGGGGLGGGGGELGGSGRNVGDEERNAARIDAWVAQYLAGTEIESILTPGQANEWTFDLRADEILVAEARSDSFDPALEIVGSAGTVMASNDDRYLGDQRPIVLWRAPVDTKVTLKARSFLDRAGGRFWLRTARHETLTVGREEQKPVVNFYERPRVLRFALKAGEIVQALIAAADSPTSAPMSHRCVIGPLGLPVPNVLDAIQEALAGAFVAPIDGDYYVYHPDPVYGGQVRVGYKVLDDRTIERKSGSASLAVLDGEPALWNLALEGGEMVDLRADGLQAGSGLAVMVRPEPFAYDPKDPGTNPFAPARPKEAGSVPSIRVFDPRPRDGRRSVVATMKPCVIWVASPGRRWNRQAYSLEVSRADQPWPDGTPSKGRLPVGDSEFLSFDTEVGDVLTFRASMNGFAEHLTLFDRDLPGVWTSENQPGRASVYWNLVVRKPGRYTLHLTSIGGGGGGEFVLERHKFAPKEFKKGQPAIGDLADGKAHVWKFTARPGEPLLAHWKATVWNLDVAIYTKDGQPFGWPTTIVDDQNEYGILKVEKPTEIMIVILPSGSKSKYSISLLDLPGRVPGS
jgi:hypothetical protein